MQHFIKLHRPAQLIRNLANFKKKYIGLISVLFFVGLNSAMPVYGFKTAISHSAKLYANLVFENVITIPGSHGVKSVLFNSVHTRLYALNLEGMSIYEYDRANKSITRTFKFKPTKATGWDYAGHQPTSSFAEKPVEGCFSHGDKILWVSLHNAGGIVPILLDAALLKMPADTAAPKKVMYTRDLLTGHRDTTELPLIKTGNTPKVIGKTADQHLLISNWRSKSISVLKLMNTAPFAQKMITIPMPAIPRGIAVDDKNHCAYIGIMGGSSIKTINCQNWEITNSFSVLQNPRHIVLDSAGRLFVSFNANSHIACIDPKTGKILFKASTNAQPRTIALSKDQKFLFVTFYAGNTIDIFKVNDHSFNKIYSLKCGGKPVGIALYENRDKIEAWVCNYQAGNLKIYTFNKR